MNVDFVNHVALVAEIDEDGRRKIIGGGRYIVSEPSEAEVAFVVIDAYQGQGIGTLLTRHLAVIARAAGLRELTADVLPENAPMQKVLRNFGFVARRGKDPQVVHWHSNSRREKGLATTAFITSSSLGRRDGALSIRAAALP
jgi:RimJ/RimL family protein N-acetyltransferase